MKFLYNSSVFALALIMKLGSFFNEKLKKGCLGRKKSLEIVKNVFSQNDQVIWMHAASLGEYEQGLPVLEKLKEKYPNYKILITFFSPSGFENVKNKPHLADAICYLPFDFEKEISQFVKTLNPKIFFTVKYDYWYNLLRELKKVNCKTFVVSALFYEKQVFFQPYGKFFVDELKKNIDCFFHQNEKSLELAKKIGLDNGIITGDTRFDRVRQIRERDLFVKYISEFKKDNLLLVFGSSWEAEEKIAESIFVKSKNTKIIIAPHDMKRGPALEQLFPSAIKYTEIDERDTQLDAQILIIDCIGLLSKLYSYADIAVVGGGFHDKGLHNILEAAVFGVPVVFGNKYSKNPEADGLIAFDGAKSFYDEHQTSEFILNLIENEKYRKEMGQNSNNFIHQQPNSSELIVEKISS
ncbi:3-deoxy-D-manno-octulosonic acid transferase [Amniculibacterium sp. G2-70]|uniref:3-deoxy-D-manno-octulosonic acid transferase n=1 Tax=Amniculibacterium sp. G2-70 TaxID=2767188 RepID=UPI0016543D10|nr:glycosyltransferase N-terminal domain-containing protein [Amniculibacterium sp. G2-70]